MNQTEALLEQNQTIKEEAGEILFKRGLLNTLSQYGNAHLSGSYVLDLMAWRDLDIYLEIENLPMESFFKLGGEIASILNPVKMSFRNETIGKTKGLPNGLYWGVYLGDERAGAWKIDIWCVDGVECERLVAYCSAIQRRLTPDTSHQILDIKSKCWKDPKYRKLYSSMDIYNAVLDAGVTSIEGFKEYLETLNSQALRINK